MIGASGIEIAGPAQERQDEVLTEGALELLTRLHGELDGTRRELLARRAERQAELHFAPDFFGRNVSTLYAEFDVHTELDENFRLFGHLGMITRISGDGHGQSRARGDLRVGAGCGCGAASTCSCRRGRRHRWRALPCGLRRPSRRLGRRGLVLVLTLLAAWR